MAPCPPPHRRGGSPGWQLVGVGVGVSLEHWGSGLGVVSPIPLAPGQPPQARTPPKPLPFVPGLSRSVVRAPRLFPLFLVTSPEAGRGRKGLPPKAWGLSHFDLKVGREPGGAAAAAAAPGRHAASRDAEAGPRGARLPRGTLPTGPRRAPRGPSLARWPRPGSAWSPKIFSVGSAGK